MATSSRPSSSREETERPSASARRTSVVRLGLPRAVSNATKAPLLTSARAARASSDNPAATRAARVLRATVSRAASFTTVGLLYRPVVTMIALALAVGSSLMYGSADFLGGLATRRAHVLRVVVIAAPASLLLELLLWPAAGASLHDRRTGVGCRLGDRLRGGVRVFVPLVGQWADERPFAPHRARLGGVSRGGRCGGRRPPPWAGRCRSGVGDGRGRDCQWRSGPSADRDPARPRWPWRAEPARRSRCSSSAWIRRRTPAALRPSSSVVQRPRLSCCPPLRRDGRGSAALARACC